MEMMTTINQFNEFKNIYQRWLEVKVVEDDYILNDFSDMLHALMETEFIQTYDSDYRRVSHVNDMRAKFLSECDNYIYSGYMDLLKVSLLEVMVDLAVRAENIMFISNKNRTHIWFSHMIVSLGLAQMSNDIFDMDEFKQIINALYAHNYEPNGSGGLFQIPYPQEDMRDLDYWSQMHRYLEYYDLHENEEWNL